MSALSRPQPTEYADYYERYVAQVPDGDIVATLDHQLSVTLELLADLPEERERYRYAPGKWSLRDVVGHLIDTERMFSFRALSMARSEGIDLPAMDQDEWAATSNAGSRPLTDLCGEWGAIRRSVVHLFASLDADAATRVGRASGCGFTVRSFAWIIAGHELWHRGGIETRYLADARPTLGGSLE